MQLCEEQVSGSSTLQVDYFTFSTSIADYIREASLVISHAGSGSIFETLRLSKPLIVVVNEDLMDNHQSELAEELAERKHLFCARPQTLREAVEAMDLTALQPYEPGDAKPGLYCDVPLGLYVIQGDNVVLIGELDREKDELPAHMTCVSETEIRKAKKAEREARDLKGSMRKRMEFLDFD
ncbi:hypothetical protein ABZP36_007305 [Zizania latifolia]